MNHSTRSLRFTVLLSTLVGASLSAQIITDSFTGSTAPGWVFDGAGYTPHLTAGTIDAEGDGWLRLTSAGIYQATSAYYDTAVTSANRTIFTSFDFASYGGTGADGITFFLFDGAANFSIGADGGSMGYAQKTGVAGLAGGYLAVSLDDFGNFSNGTEGRIGGIGSNPNAVAVRGPGSGTSGYEFIAATGDGNNAALTQQLDFIGGTRPDQTGADYRHAEILITPTNQLTVWLQFGSEGTLTKVLEADLSGYLRPETLKFGFTSGTGASTGIHELRSLTVATLVANLWDNDANNGGTATGDWGTAVNWNPDVPATGDDILFDNTFVSVDQTVNVGTGQTRTIRSIQIDAPFSYTLNNGTLRFDNVGLPGFLGISVTQTNGVSPTGHTIQSNIELAAATTIRNATTSALALTGNIANGGNALTFDGAGNTTASGVISGTGTLVKEQAGNLTLANANTYAGGTAVSGGTVTVAHNAALGSGGVTLTGGGLAGSGTRTIANTVSLQGNAGIANLTLSNTLTQHGGNRTLTLDGATLSAVNLSNDNTARTLTAHVTTDSAIAGVIANGGTGAGILAKTGTGVLTLSGANTYTGGTLINEGALRLGASNRLADTGAVTIGSSGTFDLNGFSEKIGNLTAAGGATLDFGAASGANTFVFNSYTAPTSGVLVVKNWESGTDVLATTVASQNVSSIYISGFGVAQQAGTRTDNIYGTGTNGAFLLTPTTAALNEWDGPGSNWSDKNNWTGKKAPAATEIAVFNSAGTDQPNVTLNASDTIAGLRFGTGATINYNITGANTLTLTGAVPYIQQQSANHHTLGFSTLQLNNHTVADITGAGDLTISAALSGSVNLIRDGGGAGKLILSGASSGYSGGLFVNSGVVQLASAGALGTGTATVLNGAALELTGGFSRSNAMTLAGTGVSGAGALNNLTGNNTLTGAVTLTTDTRIGSASGTLTLAGPISGSSGGADKNLTLGGVGNVTVTGAITTGAGTVTKDGTGTLTFSGGNANTYTGTTTVNAGTLVLAKTAGVNAIAGHLVIGDGTGTDTVRLGASNQIADARTVTINQGGVFNLNNFSETIGGLNSASTGAAVQLGTGTLTVNSGNANTYAGSLSGSGTLNKAGAGRLTLSGSSTTFTGTTNINSGIVALGNATALGTSTVNIAPSGNIEIQGGSTVANAFNIRGDGTGAQDGAIENFSGNNTLTGNIALGANARIGSSSGTLTLANTGTLTGSGHTLTFSGAGNTIVNRGIATGTGGLLKEGSGNLSLNAANSYTGATTIAAGKITAGTTGLFSDTAALTVNTAAVYDMTGHHETVGSLQGDGTIAFGGATLTLASGASNFGGELFGNGTIVINAGQSLTLTDSINAANVNIVLNGGSLFLGDGQSHTFANLIVNTGATSVIDFGTSGSTVALFDTVTVTHPDGTLSVQNWTDMVDYFLATNSTGPQGSSPTNQVVFAGYNGSDTKWIPYTGKGELSPVPEPATYGAFLLGASAAFVFLRRRRRA